MSGPRLLTDATVRLSPELRARLVEEEPEELALAIVGTLAEAGSIEDPLTDSFLLRGALFRACELAIAIRQDDVRVLGNAEAFVRPMGDGQMRQVIRGVPLSKGETLYQRVEHFKDENGDWKERQLPGPARAFLKAAGYDRLNGVAGCTVVMPRTVSYDGEEMPNPHRVRMRRTDGRLGETELVIIAQRVIGMAPLTGTPTVVDYTLEYQPSVELHARLQELNESRLERDYANVIMVSDDDVRREPGWRYVPLAGGVGYHCNLRAPNVRKVFTRYAKINAEAIKWAQTYARRNALRAHPAFAGMRSAVINAQGQALVPMIGWTGDGAALAAWQRLVQAIVAGEPPAAEVQQVQVHETIEAEDTEREYDEVVTDDVDQELEQRNALIESIDQVMITLRPSQVKQALPREYPGELSVEELEAILETVQAMAKENG